MRTGFRSGDERVRTKGLANEHVTERCQRIMNDAEWGRERRERERDAWRRPEALAATAQEEGEETEVKAEACRSQDCSSKS